MGTGDGAGNGAQPWAARVPRLLDATPASEAVKTLSPTTTERLIAGETPLPAGCVIRPTSWMPRARLTR